MGEIDWFGQGDYTVIHVLHSHQVQMTRLKVRFRRMMRVNGMNGQLKYASLKQRDRSFGYGNMGTLLYVQ